jgi:hypothetical protein
MKKCLTIVLFLFSGCNCDEGGLGMVSETPDSGEVDEVIMLDAGAPPECTDDLDCDDGNTCTLDQCERGTCVTSPVGTPVFETFEDGYSYSLEGAGSPVFRLVSTDLTIFLLAAPGILDKMLSTNPNESNNCQWCQCTSMCTFYNRGSPFGISSTPMPGMEPLQRFIRQGPFQHRSGIDPPGPEWSSEFTLGYVCRP